MRRRADVRHEHDADATPLRGSLDAGIVREFETALERNELVVHYQPILRLDDGSVAGVEALVRRLHPDRGVVSPAEFIPHVERTALIRAVTVFVADEALRTARSLGRAGRPLGVHALAGLAHDLGLEVVAEGVETRLAWDTALDHGCDFAQGFYAAPPMPRTELADWLDRAPAAVASVAS